MSDTGQGDTGEHGGGGNPVEHAQGKSGGEHSGEKWRDWTARGGSSDCQWRDAFLSFCEGAGVVPAQVDSTTSWSDGGGEVAESRKAAADAAIAEDAYEMSQGERDSLEKEAADRWDNFYSAHHNRFFKARNYLQREFPIVARPDEARVMMEVGAGNGSTLFPLMALNPLSHFFAFDFSAEAIAVINSQEELDRTRCNTFVCDVSNEDLDSCVPRGGVDVITSVFVFSAMSPEVMPNALRRLKEALKPGGCVVFRDYGLYDMTQLRFVRKKKRKISENFYARGDGTRTYFFSKEFAEQLFRAAGFEIAFLRYDTRELKNRKRMLTMYRVWVSALLIKPEEEAESGGANDTHTASAPGSGCDGAESSEASESRTSGNVAACGEEL